MLELEIVQKTYRQSVMIASSIIFGCGIMVAVFVLIRGVHPQDAKSIAHVDMFRLVAWMTGLTGFVSSIFIKQAILKGGRSMTYQEGLNRLTNSVLMSLALCEGPVLFGSVVYYLSKNPVDLAMPILVGIVGFSLHFPRFDEWDNWIKNNQFMQVRSS